MPNGDILDIMDTLEQKLRQLGSLQPTSKFRQESKGRIMQMIAKEEGVWFASILKKIGFVSPSPAFVQAARLRLMSRISQAHRSFGRFWLVFKSITATALVLTLSVTTTLFFVDGKQMANASEDTYMEVTVGTAMVRHADKLEWSDITAQAQIFAGDMIRVPEGAEATVHFFDDSEMRLASGSLVLVNQLTPSPVYSKQGKVEVFLHEGHVWVQTLSAADGYAGFTLSTADKTLMAESASFEVTASLFGKTQVNVYRYNVRDAQGNVLTALAKPDLTSAWINENIALDREHLAQVRDRELQVLKAATGVVPGQVLYPLKQIKERLDLALSFDPAEQAQLEVRIANKRLQEAMLLIEAGQMDEAKIALAAYQEATQVLAEKAKSDSIYKQEVTATLAVPHSKTLVAGLVKDVVDQTEVLLTDDTIDREQIKLQNAQDRLFAILDSVATGDIETAQKAIHDFKLETVSNSVFDSITDPEQKKELVALVESSREAELQILSAIAEMAQDTGNTPADLVALVGQFKDSTAADLVRASSFLPEEVLIASVSPWDATIAKVKAKTALYTTFQGQKNTIERYLNDVPALANNTAFLKQLAANLDQPRASAYVVGKIHDIEFKEREKKARQVEWKIERSKRLREANMEKIGDPAPSRE
jgi:hypothetical protein